MNSTPDEFDPYRKWLGIPLESRPPNNYQLLGIPLYEEDPDVIENAADRQMAHVRTFQNGQYSVFSQQILNELASAKICLSDKKKKQAYDSQIDESEKQHNSDKSLEQFKLSNLSHHPKNFRMSSDPSCIAWDSAVDDQKRTLAKRSRPTKKTPLLISTLGLAMLAILTVFGVLLVNGGIPSADDFSSAENNLSKKKQNVSQLNRHPSNLGSSFPRPGNSETPETMPIKNNELDPPPLTDKIPQPKEDNPKPVSPKIIPKPVAPKVNPPKQTGNSLPKLTEAETKRQAKDKFNRKYKDRISLAKTTEMKEELVKQLLEDAAKENLLPAYRFAVLDQARDLEIEMSHVEKAYEIIHEMCRHFELDKLLEKTKALNKSLSYVKSNPEALDIYKWCEKLSKEALDQQRFDDAVAIARLAQKAAKRADNLIAVNRARAAPKQIRTFEIAYKNAEEAKASLARDPRNPRANLVLGSFKCFFLREWEQGLQNLAQSSDRSLRRIANQDIRNPTNASAQWALGDAWLVLASKKNGIVARNITLRGRYWLTKALPKLPNPAKKPARQRLNEINRWLELN